MVQARAAARGRSAPCVHPPHPQLALSRGSRGSPCMPPPGFSEAFPAQSHCSGDPLRSALQASGETRPAQQRTLSGGWVGGWVGGWWVVGGLPWAGVHCTHRVFQGSVQGRSRRMSYHQGLKVRMMVG